jgi:hypothetical protein
MLLGCYQELLLDNLRRRRPFSFKGQLEMADDPIDGLRVFDYVRENRRRKYCRTYDLSKQGVSENYD